MRHRSTKHVFSLSFHSTQTLFLFCYIEMNCEGIVWLWWWHFTGKPFTLMKISRTQLELPPLSIFCDINFVQLQNGSGFWRKGLAWKSFFLKTIFIYLGIKKRLIFILVQTKRKRAPILSTDLVFTVLLWQQK